MELLTALQAAAAAGYDPPQSGVHQVRAWARTGRLPGAQGTTRGWLIPVSSLDIIRAARGNRGNKSGKPRRTNQTEADSHE